MKRYYVLTTLILLYDAKQFNDMYDTVAIASYGMTYFLS